MSGSPTLLEQLERMNKMLILSYSTQDNRIISSSAKLPIYHTQGFCDSLSCNSKYSILFLDKVPNAAEFAAKALQNLAKTLAGLISLVVQKNLVCACVAYFKAYLSRHFWHHTHTKGNIRDCYPLAMGLYPNDEILPLKDRRSLKTFSTSLYLR